MHFARGYCSQSPSEKLSSRANTLLYGSVEAGASSALIAQALHRVWSASRLESLQPIQRRGGVFHVGKMRALWRTLPAQTHVNSGVAKRATV